MAFSACDKNSIWCWLAYAFTESAGKYGTLLIIAVSSYLYTRHIDDKRQRLFSTFRSLAALLLVLAAFAWFNEHVTKEYMRYPRPSHQYMLQQGPSLLQLDSLYQLSEPLRKQLLQQIIVQHPLSFQHIDERVLAHWVQESGFSFPSGHSFNAFLLAVILAFSLQHTRKPVYHRWYWLPLAWACMVALSRVAIGAHSALDVSAGAAAGGLAGLLLIYVDAIRSRVVYKKIHR